MDVRVHGVASATIELRKGQPNEALLGRPLIERAATELFQVQHNPDTGPLASQPVDAPSRAVQCTCSTTAPTAAPSASSRCWPASSTSRRRRYAAASTRVHCSRVLLRAHPDPTWGTQPFPRRTCSRLQATATGARSGAALSCHGPPPPAWACFAWSSSAGFNTAPCFASFPRTPLP